MFALGLITSVVFFPVFMQGATTPRWVALAVGVPVMLCVTYPIPWSTVHTILALFLAWAALSLAWAPSFFDGMTALGVWALVGGAFLIGSARHSAAGLFKGLAVGVGINAAVALAQWLGWQQPWTEWASPAALYGNRNMLAEVAALVLVGCLALRLWYFAPLCVLPLLTGPSRTAWLAVGAAGMLWLWQWNRAAFLAAVAVGVVSVPYVINIDKLSSDQRRTIWTDTAKATTVLGAGVGSFAGNYPAFASVNTLKERPEDVHNDYLQLAYELGAPGAVLFVAFLALCLFTSAPERFVLVALMTEALFAFPLHLPTTALVFGVVAGCCSRDWLRFWSYAPRRGNPPHWRTAQNKFGLRATGRASPSLEPDFSENTRASVYAVAKRRADDVAGDVAFNRWRAGFRSELQRSDASEAIRFEPVARS